MQLQVSNIIGGGGVPSSGSTGVTLSASQPTLLTEAGAKVYALPAPAVGRRVTIIKQSTSTSDQTVLSTLSGTAATIGLAGKTLTFNTGAQAVELLGVSATRWEIVSNVGTVVLS